MRLIDADAVDDIIQTLNENGWHITRDEYKRIDRILFEMPTVYMVRCKDCRWATAVEHEFVQGADIHCQKHNCFTNHDSHCSSWEEINDERNKSD